MGTLRYFLVIEFAYVKDMMVLSQRKYVLLSGCKLKNTPIDQSPSFWDSLAEVFEDVRRYRRLIGKLIYLTVTRLDISYTVGLFSQFMYESRIVHWQGTFCVLAYVKSNHGRGLIYKKHGHLHVEFFSNFGYVGDKGDRKSTLGYCTYVDGNLVTWRSKK